MWVVKLGGSLAQSPVLPAWLDELAGHGGGRAIIVPGGGPFADLVRSEQARTGFDDAAAHWMAILAMEQFGFMLAALEPRLCTAAFAAELHDARARRQVPVWLAYPMVYRDDSLPRDWTVSADSLALWLARELGAEALLLVKSALPHAPLRDAAALADAGVVDRHFPALARTYPGDVRLLGPDAAADLGAALAGGRLPGLSLRSDA